MFDQLRPARDFHIVCNLSVNGGSTNSRPYLCDFGNGTAMTFAEASERMDEIEKHSAKPEAYSIYSPKYDNPHFIER